MANNIKILVHSENELLQEISLTNEQTYTLKAQENVTYELKNTDKNTAPEEILVKRNGDDLELYTDANATAPVAKIEGYFLLASVSPLVGLAESGEFYPFVPQTGNVNQLPWELKEGDSSYQSLGHDTPGSKVPWWPILIAGLLIGGGLAAASSSSSSGGGADDHSTKPDKPTVNEIINNRDNDGNLTDTTIIGEATPGDKIIVTDKDGNVVGEGEADEEGNYEVEVPGGLEDGEDYDVEAEKDGERSDPETVTGKTTPPDKPIIDEVKNQFDEEGEPESTTVIGKAEPGSNVEITDKDGNVVGEDTADDEGNFEITVQPPLKDGDKYDVTATDDYNNTSEPEVVIGDTTPPSIEDLEIIQVDTSVPADDEPNQTVIEFTTDDPNPGTLDIVYTDEEGNVIQPEGINFDSNGKVIAVFDPALAADTKITVTATDPMGNSNNATETVPDTIGRYADDEAPQAPIIDDISHDKSSVDNEDHTTTIKGEVKDQDGDPEVGATVVVKDNEGNPILDENGEPITATTDEEGKFEIELPLLDEEEHTITATDKAGNESDPTDFIVDHTPPDAPIIDIENGDITNNGDDTTTIKGKVENGKDGGPEVGATVVVKDEDGNPLKDEDGNIITAITDENGHFEITVPELTHGEKYGVTATDEAGNESDPKEVLGDTEVSALDDDAIFIGENGDEWITEDEINDDGQVKITVSLPDGGLADDETLVVMANGKEYPVTEDDISGEEATIYVDAPGEGEELTVEASIKDYYNNQSEPVEQAATQDTIGPDITDVERDEATGDVTGKTEPGATIVDSSDEPITQEDGTPIVADEDGSFEIPADQVPDDGNIKAQDEAGNTGNPVNVHSLPAITDALDFVEAYVDGEKQERDPDDPEPLTSGDITNDNRPLFEIPADQNVNETVLLINGVAVEAEKVERDGKTYLQPKAELADGEHSIAYTTDNTLQPGEDTSTVALDEQSNAFDITVDTDSPEILEVEQESVNELAITVDEDADIEIIDENGNVLGTGTVAANEKTIIELADGNKLTDGQKVNIIATDKAGNQGTLGDDLFEAQMDRTLAVNNNEELVLDLTPTEREATEDETTVGTTVRSFGAVSAGLGGAADAGVLDFANNAINIEVAEGTERKLDLYAGGGGISIADFYDLVVFKEDAYGNTKYYDYYDDWFAVPFLGMTKEGSITINEPGNYHIMLVAKGGVKAIGGTELKVIKDTVIDYNDYESASGRKQGNMMTDPNFLGENDELGEDIFVSEDTTVTSVTYDGVSYDVPSNKSVSIEAEHGTLKVWADGEYSYTLREGAEPEFGDTERFEYTITNEKTKESSTAELNISLVQTPSSLIPNTTETLFLAPEAEKIDIPDDMVLSKKTWGSVAGIGLGPVADVGLITVENGLEITVGENQVRDVSFSGTTGAPVAVGYNPVDFIVYKKEVTPNGAFWQEYLVVEDWFGMVGAVIGAGQSTENMDLRLDEGEYKVMLLQHMGGISVAPIVELHIESDELYEYQETVTSLDANVEFDEGYNLYSLGGIKRGAENEVEVEGKYGTLTMQKDGSYTYELFSGFDSKNVGEIESFHYSVVNSDGRIKTSTLNIVIDNVQANDDFGSAYFGMDNIEAYEGWGVDLRTTGGSTKTYSKDISVGENQIFDLSLSYDINQIGTVLGGADNYTIRLKDKITGEIIETHLDVNGSKGVKDTWDLHLTEGEYTVEVLVSPRALNQQNVKLNLSGTVTSLDHFQTEESNHQIKEGNLLDNDSYKESTGDAEFAHLEINGKPIDIVVNGDFDNNMYKSITLDGEHGTLTVREDGSYTYEAHGNSYGIDEFDYKLISINGSSSSAKLVFNAGMNITGSQYDDIITGSDGSDTLRYELLDNEDATGGNGTDTWTDFHIGDVELDVAADQIDLSKLLEGVDTNNASEYLKVEHNAADNTLTLSIDRDGAGSKFDYEALLVLENQTDAIDLEDLLNNQQIIF